jgi:predicted RNA-binding protein with PIN domain
MTKKIIVDGYNLIHKIPNLKSLLHRDLEQTRERLITLLGSYGERRKVEVVITFDGTLLHSGHSLNTPKIKVLFSRPPQKADQLIKSLIEQTKHKKLLMVVSSDREITRFAKVCGCEIKSSEEFYESVTRKPKLAEEEKKTLTLTDAEIKEWKKIFDGKGPI